MLQVTGSDALKVIFCDRPPRPGHNSGRRARIEGQEVGTTPITRTAGRRGLGTLCRATEGHRALGGIVGGWLGDSSTVRLPGCVQIKSSDPAVNAEKPRPLSCPMNSCVTGAHRPAHAAVAGRNRFVTPGVPSPVLRATAKGTVGEETRPCGPPVPTRTAPALYRRPCGTADPPPRTAERLARGGAESVPLSREPWRIPPCAGCGGWFLSTT